MNNNFDPDYPEVKRTYTPEEAGHDKKRRPASRYDVKRLKKKKVNFAAFLLILIFAAICALCIYLIASGKSTNDLPQKIEPYESSADTTPAETTDDGLDYTVISLDEDMIYYGDLILVNSSNQYYFPKEAENNLVSISEEKNDYYKLSNYSTYLSKKVVEKFNELTVDYYNQTGFKWMQVNSAYRSKEDQTSLYAEYAEERGEDYAKAYVANPGFSEHHTGLAMDLNVNVDGSIYYVESYDGCEWFRENAKNYGFILRYPDDKVYMTGINYESWHYRYVGVPHSQIMSDLNFCHEEYIKYLKDYTYDTVRLGYNADTGVYDIPKDTEYDGGIMIYYAESEGDETKVKVPKGAEYTISGNNVDGFIITVGEQ